MPLACDGKVEPVGRQDEFLCEGDGGGERREREGVGKWGDGMRRLYTFHRVL